MPKSCAIDLGIFVVLKHGTMNNDFFLFLRKLFLFSLTEINKTISLIYNYDILSLIIF